MSFKLNFVHLLILFATVFVLNSTNYTVTESYGTNEISLEKAKYKDVPPFKVAKKKTFDASFFNLRFSLDYFFTITPEPTVLVDQFKNSDLYWTSSGLSPPV